MGKLPVAGLFQCFGRLLKQYSSETIILLLAKQSSSWQGSFCMAFDEIAERPIHIGGRDYPPLSIERDAQTHSTLASMRGKLILVRDFEVDYPRYDQRSELPMGMDLQALKTDLLEWNQPQAEANLGGLRDYWQQSEKALTHLLDCQGHSYHWSWFNLFKNAALKTRDPSGPHDHNCPAIQHHPGEVTLSSAEYAYQSVLEHSFDQAAGLNGALYRFLSVASARRFPSASADKNLSGILWLDFVPHYQLQGQANQRLVATLIRQNAPYAQAFSNYFHAPVNEDFASRAWSGRDFQSLQNCGPLQNSDQLQLHGDFLYYCQHASDGQQANVLLYQMINQSVLLRLNNQYVNDELQTFKQIQPAWEQQYLYYRQGQNLYRQGFTALKNERLVILSLGEFQNFHDGLLAALDETKKITQNTARLLVINHYAFLSEQHLLISSTDFGQTTLAIYHLTDDVEQYRGQSIRRLNKLKDYAWQTCHPSMKIFHNDMACDDIAILEQDQLHLLSHVHHQRSLVSLTELGGPHCIDLKLCRQGALLNLFLLLDIHGAAQKSRQIVHLQVGQHNQRPQPYRLHTGSSDLVLGDLCEQQKWLLAHDGHRLMVIDYHARVLRWQAHHQGGGIMAARFDATPNRLWVAYRQRFGAGLQRYFLPSQWSVETHDCALENGLKCDEKAGVETAPVKFTQHDKKDCHGKENCH